MNLLPHRLKKLVFFTGGQISQVQVQFALSIEANNKVSLSPTFANSFSSPVAFQGPWRGPVSPKKTRPRSVELGNGYTCPTVPSTHLTFSALTVRRETDGVRRLTAESLIVSERFSATTRRGRAVTCSGVSGLLFSQEVGKV